MKKLLIIIPAVILLSSCAGVKEEETAAKSSVNENVLSLTQDQLKNAGIEIATAQQRNLPSLLKLSGKVDVPPENVVSISFPLGGYLKTTSLIEGMAVKKGQALAVMEDPLIIQLQQDYLTCKTKLAYAEQEYNRQKELNQSKASSDKLFQQAQAEYSGQKILLASLSQKLQLAGIQPARLNESNISRSVNIYSPISGFVADVKVNVGRYVNPSDVLFDIIDPGDIHLALNVFEKDINLLSVGQKIVAYTNGNPARKYDAVVRLVGRELSGERSIEVHCHFLNRDAALLPGMFMNAEVEVSNKLAVVLPSDAVVSFENKQYVFTALDGGRFEMKEISAGNSENGFTEILSTEAISDKKIVVKGAYTLLMAMKNTSDE